MLTLLYFLVLVAAVTGLAIYVRRLGRPVWAETSEAARGPWCAACGYEIRLPESAACAECGEDLTERDALALRESRSRWPLLWQVPLALVICSFAWQGGAWLAIPETTHLSLSERWEQPVSDAYETVAMWSLSFGTLYRWQNLENHAQPRSFSLYLVGSPHDVANLHVRSSMQWDASDRNIR